MGNELCWSPLECKHNLYHKCDDRIIQDMLSFTLLSGDMNESRAVVDVSFVGIAAETSLEVVKPGAVELQALGHGLQQQSLRRATISLSVY